MAKSAFVRDGFHLSIPLPTARKITEKRCQAPTTTRPQKSPLPNSPIGVGTELNTYHIGNARSATAKPADRLEPWGPILDTTENITTMNTPKWIKAMIGTIRVYLHTLRFDDFAAGVL